VDQIEIRLQPLAIFAGKAGEGVSSRVMIGLVTDDDAVQWQGSTLSSGRWSRWPPSGRKSTGYLRRERSMHLHRTVARCDSDSAGASRSKAGVDAARDPSKIKIVRQALVNSSTRQA
jgi:hypothetical protein